MQDKIRAYSGDGAALSNYSTCRELATHAQLSESYHQMGDTEMGGSARRLWKEIGLAGAGATST